VKSMKKAYVGKWRIQEMDAWDKDFIDMIVPGHLIIEKDGTGFFQFGTVEGEIDCRIEKVYDKERIDFSWEGEEEGDSASGRGWASIEGERMTGKIYFHLGDESGFKATKE